MCKLKEARMSIQESIKDTAKVVSTTIKYAAERIEVATYNSRYQDFQEWYEERREEELVPPDMREDYIKYCLKRKR